MIESPNELFQFVKGISWQSTKRQEKVSVELQPDCFSWATTTPTQNYFFRIPLENFLFNSPLYLTGRVDGWGIICYPEERNLPFKAHVQLSWTYQIFRLRWNFQIKRSTWIRKESLRFSWCEKKIKVFNFSRTPISNISFNMCCELNEIEKV